MGTIAARDCLRVLELTEQVAAAQLITVMQGIWLRMKVNPAAQLKSSLEEMFGSLKDMIGVIEEDRRLEPDLLLILGHIRACAWKLYA